MIHVMKARVFQKYCAIIIALLLLIFLPIFNYSKYFYLQREGSFFNSNQYSPLVTKRENKLRFFQKVYYVI